MPRRSARARPLWAIFVGGVVAACVARPAFASPPDGAGIARVLGDRAARVLSPGTDRVGALVAIPPGRTAESLGLVELAPGIGRMHGTPASIVGFADAHPGARVEIAPPLHLSMALARAYVHAAGAPGGPVGPADGAGALVGIADTGLDVTHPDFVTAGGASRVAWLLDLSHEGLGLHPELEQQFGIKDQSGKVTNGAVLSGADIDQRIAQKLWVPIDEVGHGTHVAGIAASSGKTYKGIAPAARLIVARVTRSAAITILTDDMLLGAAFIFDRAAAEHQPVAANLSLGSNFGPHDGTTLWEKTLASFVGPDHPGRVLVAAAGNSGSIASAPTHQTAYVPKGSAVRVPLATNGSTTGSIQIWVTERPGATFDIGLEGPNGTLVPPLPDGEQRGAPKDASGLEAGVIHGSSAPGSVVPGDSRGAIVVLGGTIPAGRYSVVLVGEGMADLFLEVSGDGATTTGFRDGVRAGTVNLPATHPSVIGVGCTVSGTGWRAISGGHFGLPKVSVLDAFGGRVAEDAGLRSPEDGEVCWFSSAGPTVTGLAKPDILAPGAPIAASLSAQALPGVPTSIFTFAACPVPPGQTTPDGLCKQVDAGHAISVGTSMASPMVAGAAAALLQRDPSLTQDLVRALLQAGAHRVRGPAPFMDQSSVGELDVAGALAALGELGAPDGVPNPDTSWMTLSSDYVPADGSTPVTALVELRTGDPRQRASLFEASRLAATVVVGERTFVPEIARVAPGLFAFSFTVPAGLGGERATFALTFDGEPIVPSISVPVGTDPWASGYPSIAYGGCATSAPAPLGTLGAIAVCVALAIVARRRRR